MIINIINQKLYLDKDYELAWPGELKIGRSVAPSHPKDELLFGGVHGWWCSKVKKVATFEAVRT